MIKSYCALQEDIILSNHPHNNRRRIQQNTTLETRFSFPFQLDMFTYSSPIHLDYKTSALKK